MSEIVNAQIKSTMLGVEDHGHMTCQIFLAYDEHQTQGFGGYGLDSTNPADNNNSGIKFIRELLQAVGVDRWEDLKGQYVRVKYDGPEYQPTILAIGHITKDKWFSPAEFYKKYYPKAAK